MDTAAYIPLPGSHRPDGGGQRGAKAFLVGAATMIEVQPGDRVLVALGSMTGASSLGSVDAAPAMGAEPNGGAWALWERIAAGQPEAVGVAWGYGLNMDRPGDFTGKPMPACTGREITAEVLGHLRLEAEAAAILQACICIPCMMPFITSQFMPRRRGDRPQVLPHGTRNLAFIGQFVELPLDVVFTVECSIRSAQVAVHGLLGLPHGPPPVYQGRFDPRVLLRAFRALHDMRA